MKSGANYRIVNSFGPLAAVMAWLMFAGVTAVQGQEPGLPASGDSVETVAYPAEFFLQYNPVNARDMIAQVPGFQIDEGGDARGFGGTAGNILIDGERPSTKNDDAGAILSRIPATRVLRIDLIRGETGGLNLRGQAVIVNVILREGTGTSTNWQTRARTTANTDTVNLDGSLSRTATLGSTRFTVGVEGGEDRSHQQRGLELLLVNSGIGEERFEIADSESKRRSLNLNTESLLGATLVHVNAQIGRNNSANFEDSRRRARLPQFSSRSVLEGSDNTIDTLELGADAEFPVAEDFMAKTIVLLNLIDSTEGSSVRQLDSLGNFQAASRSIRQTDESELIARLELDWSGIRGHHLAANIEGTVNNLDNALVLFRDSGAGAQELPLPGANTEVEEIRWDVEFSHFWNSGPVSLESGLAAETSTISQHGDAQRKRSFFFIKPRVLLAYAPVPERQFRASLQREVAQLDFNDFVSSTNFGDNQFDLGNPELEPETTWISSLTYEQRFGEISVLNLTAFHHWIRDVQDVLPLSGIFEVPGNIGDGRRWGMETALTFSLDRLGIAGTRIDLNGRWQDSSVNDPVTGRSRVLSEEGRYTLRMNFRQNLQGSTFSWGGMVAIAAEVPLFGLDEFIVTRDIDDTVDMDLFVETTRWFGVRTRLQFGNIFNRTFHRDRQVFTGPRDLTPLAFRELRNRTRGHSVELSVTGNF